jgi:hypothetical protein
MSTKTCSNNMVSPNDHVVMNHQNQTPNKWHMRPCSLHPLPTTVLDSHGSLLLVDLSDGHYRFLDLAVCESLMQRHVDPDEAGFQAGR